MNFHKDLLAMGREVHYWERLRMPVPYIAMEINAQRDKYRVLRDNILMVGGCFTRLTHSFFAQFQFDNGRKQGACVCGLLGSNTLMVSGRPGGAHHYWGQAGMVGLRSQTLLRAAHTISPHPADTG